YADVVLLESPLSPYHFFTPGVTTQATALATPGVVIALCRCFLRYFRARIAAVQPLWGNRRIRKKSYAKLTVFS
ncbi:hypothetical protein, partial [Klebsiella pneumoniae]|uniref:hypothetical protein n=2 Tax=Klebsiella pneumoniae TaxID=573 RepID=UPI001C69DD17